MARPNVPKFGNWENEESVPYTLVFSNARKNRGTGKMINPNDPQENPDMFSKTSPSPPAPAPAKPIRTKPEEPVGRGAIRPAPDHKVSREDVDFRKQSSPTPRSENMVQKSSNESTHRNYGGLGGRSNGPARQNAGSDYSIKKSPLHQHYQARVSAKGNGIPASEVKNSYDSSHGSAGRSRLRSADGTPDRSSAIPKFGGWSDDDPQSAENFTEMFDNARKGRNVGPGNFSGTPKHPSHNKPKHQFNKNQKKRCWPFF